MLIQAWLGNAENIRNNVKKKRYTIVTNYFRRINDQVV